MAAKHWTRVEHLQLRIRHSHLRVSLHHVGPGVGESHGQHADRGGEDCNPPAGRLQTEECDGQVAIESRQCNQARGCRDPGEIAPEEGKQRGGHSGQ